MHDPRYVAAMIAVMAAVTMLLRAAPFLLFRGKATPPYITFLGKYLPFAVMGMLVVYCLRNVSVTAAPFGIPELIAVAVVAALHAWRRNTLLSIVTGTIVYMLLTQFVF